MAQPSTITILLFCGMGLLIVGTAGGDSAIGSLGLIFLTAVLSTCLLRGIGSFTGAILVIAGAGLLFVEARVLPGHGICAVAGMACVFIGTQQTIGVLDGGGMRALIVSSTVTGLSFAELLVSIPGSNQWKDLNRRLRVTTGNLVDLSTTKNAHVETSTSGDVRVQKIGTRYPFGASLEPDDLQKDLNALRESCIPVIAEETQAERDLLSLKDEEIKMYAEAKSAAAQGRDDLALQILISREPLLERVADAERRLFDAEDRARTARHNVELCRDRLKVAESRSGKCDRLREMISEVELLSARDLHTKRQIAKLAESASSEKQGQAAEGAAAVLPSAAHKKRAANALAALKEELRRKESEQDGTQQTINLD